VSDDHSSLPDGALRLLLGPIDSFEKLELLIALHATGNSPLTLEALEAHTGAPGAVLKIALEQLTAGGVVARRGESWRLSPAYDDSAIGELILAWYSNRHAVLNFMTQRSLERIRASAARRFADAFKLRGGTRDGGGEDG
jgi:DNA-binding IclR family transcriptional regulator